MFMGKNATKNCNNRISRNVVIKNAMPTVNTYSPQIQLIVFLDVAWSKLLMIVICPHSRKFGYPIPLHRLLMVFKSVGICHIINRNRLIKNILPLTEKLMVI